MMMVLPLLKRAWSSVTINSHSAAFKDFETRPNALSGTMKDSAFSDLKFLLMKRTRRWPSVATNFDSSGPMRSEEHTSELQSRGHLVCRLLLEKKKNTHKYRSIYRKSIVSDR